MSVLPFAVSALASVISYQRAKAESLGLEAKGGLMERAERIVALCLGLFLEPWIDGALVVILWIMLVLIAITAVQRFVKVWKQAAVAPVTQARIDLRREKRAERREARVERRVARVQRRRTRVPLSERVPRRQD
jgi:CDP-diacylglycerol--glycerol-3-phosphate 3-phosphatidyltransferase